MPGDWQGHPLRKDYPLGYEEVQFSFNFDQIEKKKPYAKSDEWPRGRPPRLSGERLTADAEHQLLETTLDELKHLFSPRATATRWC